MGGSATRRPRGVRARRRADRRLPGRPAAQPDAAATTANGDDARAVTAAGPAGPSAGPDRHRQSVRGPARDDAATGRRGRQPVGSFGRRRAVPGRAADRRAEGDGRLGRNVRRAAGVPRRRRSPPPGRRDRVADHHLPRPRAVPAAISGSVRGRSTRRQGKRRRRSWTSFPISVRSPSADARRPSNRIGRAIAS